MDTISQHQMLASIAAGGGGTALLGATLGRQEMSAALSTLVRPAVTKRPGALSRLLSAYCHRIAGYFIRRDAIARLSEFAGATALSLAAAGLGLIGRAYAETPPPNVSTGTVASEALFQEPSQMSSLVQEPSSSTDLTLIARRSLLAGAIALPLVTAPLTLIAPAAVQAAEPWQQSCAYKTQFGVLGPGMAIVADYCTRLTFCQSIADQSNPNMAQKGCYGFAPQAASAPVFASKHR